MVCSVETIMSWSNNVAYFDWVVLMDDYDTMQGFLILTKVRFATRNYVSHKVNTILCSRLLYHEHINYILLLTMYILWWNLVYSEPCMFCDWTTPRRFSPRKFPSQTISNPENSPPDNSPLIILSEKGIRIISDVLHKICRCLWSRPWSGHRWEMSGISDPQTMIKSLQHWIPAKLTSCLFLTIFVFDLLKSSM